MRPATLSQEPTSAPAASWVLPLATLRQDLALGAEGKLGVATGNTPPGPGLGAAGELGVQPLATLRQDLASAPPASWELPLATLCQDRPRRRR
ncbi:hypothetical protein N5K55_21835 [Pseudomonas aeruginosa]|nr:hypothetical protein [Pseudomonas aeruginosa]